MARTSRERTKPGEPGKRESASDAVTSLGAGLGGLLGRLGTVVENLGRLAEAGEELSRSGEITGLDSSGKVRGVYGFSVKTGLGEQGQREFKVEPFGNIRRQPSGQAVVDELREPMVDVHEEDDGVWVLAEIPGVSKKDVQVELSGDRLSVFAQHGPTRYRKEVVLPQPFPPEKMRWTCKNGILSIRLEQ
jgi:HSP20 family protein